MPHLPPAYELVREGGTTAVPIGDGMVGIGRDPRNTLVVDHPRVSAFHARIWSDGQRVWVADAGSTHGTRVGDAPVLRATPLAAGDRLTLASAVVLTVRASVGSPATPWMIEDVASGVKVRPRGGVLRIGGPDADLRTDRAHGMIQRLGDAVAWMGGAGVVRLPPGQVVTVDGLALRLIEVTPAPLSSTDGRPDAALALVIEGQRDARGRATVRILEPGGAVVATFERTRAAQILCVLAEAWSPGGGWMEDDALRQQVWGHSDANTLNVNLTRLRTRLRDQGLTEDLVERRPGQTRLRVARARVC